MCIGDKGHGGRFEEDDDDGVRVHASDAEGVWAAGGEVIDFWRDDPRETVVEGRGEGAAFGGWGGGPAVGGGVVPGACDFEGWGSGVRAPPEGS